MKIGRQAHRHSAISTSNESTIVVRGQDLVQDLIGQLSFTDHIWLLITGNRPTAVQRRTLDSTLVAIAEHGLVPSVQASRMTYAAAPEALQAAVAAGILGCGSVILGASEAAGKFYAEILAVQDAGASASDAIAQVVGRYRAAKLAIPGYGHPLHKGYDPRARRLFELAVENGASGRHCALAHAVEEAIPALVGRTLAINVSGAIPAVLLDAGFPLQALKGVPILARTASLVAHLLEEQLRPIGFVLSHAAAKAIEYDGTVPEGFVPGEGT